MPLTLFKVVVLPLFEDFIGKPERDVAPIDQRLVLLCPVSDFERRACFRTHDFLRFKVFLMVLTKLNTPTTENVCVCTGFF
jgi:hypothetical protein